MPAASATPAAARPFGRARLTQVHDRTRRIRRVRHFAFAGLCAILLGASPALAQDSAESTAIGRAIQSSVGGKLKSVYRARGFWPLWIHDGRIGPEAGRLIDLLETAHADGLDPKDYGVARLREAIDSAEDGDAKTLANLELRLTKSFVAYVRDVRAAGRPKIRYLDPELEPRKLDDEEILRGAALAPSFAEYLRDGGWMNPAYMRLRTAIARYDTTWAELPAVEISPGGRLKQGDSGIRVAELRERLGLEPGQRFDKPLTTKLRAFQAAHGLPVDGIAGPGTLAALNRDPAQIERLLRLNLDRARILPGPQTRHILVDIASARLTYYRDGKEEGSMKVVVGKPDEQTPMLAGMLRYATFNPYWNIPEDLVSRRVAQRFIKREPVTRSYEVLSDWGANPARIDPATVDWQAVADGAETPRVRQLPGSGNAMGRMKFMFPNDLGIYLHDTPEKNLFAKAVRQFSSGCVRLEDAPRLARWLFGDLPAVDPDLPEQNVALPTPVPVYLTYLTASPTANGIAFLNDAYGRDGGDQEQLARR